MTRPLLDAGVAGGVTAWKVTELADWAEYSAAGRWFLVGHVATAAAVFAAAMRALAHSDAAAASHLRRSVWVAPAFIETTDELIEAGDAA